MNILFWKEVDEDATSTMCLLEKSVGIDTDKIYDVLECVPNSLLVQIPIVKGILCLIVILYFLIVE